MPKELTDALRRIENLTASCTERLLSAQARWNTAPRAPDELKAQLAQQTPRPRADEETDQPMAVHDNW